MVGKNSLPRDLTLKSRTEIAELLREGRRFPTGFFSLIWMPGDTFKYGILVSRRHGPAVRRNRLKRIYREAVRLSRSRLELPGKVLVLPRILGREPELKQLVADVTGLFQRLNLQK